MNLTVCSVAPWKYLPLRLFVIFVFIVAGFLSNRQQEIFTWERMSKATPYNPLGIFGIVGGILFLLWILYYIFFYAMNEWKHVYIKDGYLYRVGFKLMSLAAARSGITKITRIGNIDYILINADQKSIKINIYGVKESKSEILDRLKAAGMRICE